MRCFKVTKYVILNGQVVGYELTHKKVKNVNLRIKADGKVMVSANRSVPIKFIEDFMVSKADFIIKALEKSKKKVNEPPKQYFSAEEIKPCILEICKRVYPYFEKLGVKYPEIKFRSMVSKWGSCNSTRKILTFNTKLMYVPEECVEYVVLHEFCHFLQANHSPAYYRELEKVCPDWKRRREMMKGVNVR